MAGIQSFVIMIKLSFTIYTKYLLFSFDQKTIKFLFAGIMLCILSSVGNAQLEETIAKVKPSIVGIGTYQKTKSPSLTYMGTGFAVGDGLHIVTNAHVIRETLDFKNMEKHVVITGQDNKPELRDASIVFLDKEHDIALLKISGTALPALKLGNSTTVREGRRMAYTGFPIGMVLGFYPVTHQAIISSVTPIIRPAHNATQLNAKLIRRLQSPFMVFQLDGVAYPGNSGSPLYDPDTGLVYGIINMVYVKGKKETALSSPSGISYAIPGKHIVNLLGKVNFQN